MLCTFAIMKKCFTINQFRSYEEILSYAYLFRNNMAQGVEIFFPIELSTERQEEYARGIKELQKYNIEVVMHLPHGPKYSLCNLGEYERVVKDMLRSIEYSKQFGVKKFTLHLGYVNGPRQPYIDHIIPILQTLCDYASFGEIMIENMPGDNELGYSPDEIYNIIKQANRSNLKFIFDTGHANVSNFTIQAYIDKLKPLLRHVHISDNKGLSDEHKRVGLGNIDFCAFFKSIKGYQDLICLEILYKDLDELLLNFESIKEYDEILD